jgi:hypothetical protein
MGKYLAIPISRSPTLKTDECADMPVSPLIVIGFPRSIAT